MIFLLICLAENLLGRKMDNAPFGWRDLKALIFEMADYGTRLPFVKQEFYFQC